MGSAGTRFQARLPLRSPACADEAVGRVFADEGKPEGPFCEYVDEGHVRMGGGST